MKHGKLNIVIDGSWGSTGKGKLCAWLAKKYDVAVSICDFQNNAGHTVVLDDGTRHVFQQIPVAAVNPDTMLLISPAATIKVEKLMQEIEIHSVWKRLRIHPLAGIITQECLDYERENLVSISSTLKGCGAATGMKAMRHPGVKLAKDVPEFRPFIADTTELLQLQLKSGAMCMMETAQGFDLSLNHGHLYPFVTSRDVTTASSLNNVGIPPQLIGDVYGCIRTYPIRVGNVYGADGEMIGFSGPHYKDQKELDWAELAQLSGSNVSLEERTTVTNKVRRIFTFSNTQFRKFLDVCAPTKIFVNFINHVNSDDLSKRGWNELSQESRDFIEGLSAQCEMNWYANMSTPKVALIGTGEKMSDIIILE